MNIGENPLLKKSRSSRSLIGTRLSGSFSHAFSTTQQNSLNSRLQVHSPFSKLANTSVSSKSEGERNESHQLGKVRPQPDALKGPYLHHVTSDDPQFFGSFPSIPSDSLVIGSRSTQMLDINGNRETRLPIEKRVPPDTSLKKEDDTFSSPTFDSLLRDKGDFVAADPHQGGLRYSSVGSQQCSTPTIATENSSKVLNAANGLLPDTRSAANRRSSCSSAALEENAGDLSALMIKGATDLRLAKVTLEQKAQESEKLRSELSIAISDRDGLLRRIDIMKKKSKEGLELSARQLSEMKATMESLKSQSKCCFELVDEMRSSSTEFEDVKEMASQASKQIKHLLGDKGTFQPTEDLRIALHDIQQEINNKQQVIDLLRDKLEFLQGEYAEAKNRIIILEKMQIEGNDALRSTSQMVGDADKRIVELTRALNEQQQVNADNLVKNAELESIIRSKEAEKAELMQSNIEKDGAISQIEPLREECLKLRVYVEERDKQLIDLQKLKDELAQHVFAREELTRNLSAKDVLIRDSADSLDALRVRLARTETKLEEHSTQNTAFVKELSEARKQLDSEAAQRAKITLEKDALVTQASDLSSRLEISVKEGEDLKERARLSDTKNEILQDRFDEQTLMLRVEKRAHGDVLERILTSEAAHVSNLEGCKKEYEVKIARLEEQNRALLDKIREQDTHMRTGQQESSIRLAMLQEEHAKEMRETLGKCESSSQERDKLVKELEEANSETQLLHVKLQALQVEASGLHKELLEASLPSPAQLMEVADLKARIASAEKERDMTVFRSKTLILRYETGDLSNEERLLIDTIHRATQSSHEQQLVAKSNEVRQRDNALKALEKRKSDLEMQLAHLLNAQGQERTEMSIVPPARSLIDPDSWMSSQASSSPHFRKVQAPDRDGPTTLREIDFAETVATINPRVLQPSHRNDPNQAPSMDVVPPAEGAAALKTVKPSNTTTFANLTQTADDSDEIRDSVVVAHEDAVIPTSKRKRENQTVNAQEKSRPIRRTRTATRNQATDPATDIEATYKDTMAAPKVKARKRR